MGGGGGGGGECMRCAMDGEGSFVVSEFSWNLCPLSVAWEEDRRGQGCSRLHSACDAMHALI